MTIHIIGISDYEEAKLNNELLNLVRKNTYFAGGKRHYEKVKHLLPEGAKWTNIIIPISKLTDELTNNSSDWIVFASGDPLFYGIANTIKRDVNGANIKLYSTFNSLQMLAHEIAIPYGLFETISLTGRPWKKFDKALILGKSKMGILTDKKHTPQSIAQRMLDYNYSNYKMYIGEKVGSKNMKISFLSIEEASNKEFEMPNCLFIEKTKDIIKCKGIPDKEFEGLAGRPKMITKMPIRVATMAFLQLERHQVFWDVGFCTGSISIEARLNAPDIEIRAFEIREESRGIMTRNCKKFGIPNIDFHIGDYLSIEKDKFKNPDVVFIGGYGGKLEEFLDDINNRLHKAGIIGFNAVSEKSKTRFINWAEENKYTIITNSTIILDDNNPITILVIEKQ